MKRKLTSLVLAIAVMASMSVPVFAADCRTTTRSACGNELLWQMLCRYGSFRGNSSGNNCDNGSCVGQTLDVNELLNQLLAQYYGATPSTPSKQPTQPAEQDKPAEPAEPGKPVEPTKPTEQETPAQPEKPAEQQKPAASAADAYEQEVIRLVNIERAKYGLAALTEDASLTRTARMKSQDMRDRGYFDHNSPTYGSPFQLMKSQGVTYRTAGENIAMGYATPQAVVNAWMNSSGHRANILNASYTRIGVGYVASGNYWTQHFAG